MAFVHESLRKRYHFRNVVCFRLCDVACSKIIGLPILNDIPCEKYVLKSMFSAKIEEDVIKYPLKIIVSPPQ